MTLEHNETTKLLGECCKALYEKKADDISVIDLRGKSSITDFYVIATGTSNPHLKALVKSAEKALFEHGDKVKSQKDADSGWMILDGFDFMVHLFDEESREFYGLESLWNDAETLDWETFVKADQLGCVFDWDGVVIDSSKQHERSWEMLAEEVGKPLPANHFEVGFRQKKCLDYS